MWVFWLTSIRATLPFFSAVGAEMTNSVMNSYYLLFVTTLMTGLTFTFPVFLVLLVKYGVIGTSLLRKNRSNFDGDTQFIFKPSSSGLRPNASPITLVISV